MVSSLSNVDEPYLIAHKVRGEAAFDVAIKQPCPECDTYIEADGHIEYSSQSGCPECDGEGHWWICSTSGHRAYPYWDIAVAELYLDTNVSRNIIDPINLLDKLPPMPEGLPDHYRVNASPRAKVAEVGRSLLAQLGLARKPQPIKRRI